MQFLPKIPTTRFTEGEAAMVKDRKVKAGVQHEAARRALTIIAAAAKAGTKLNYQDLAAALGRKRTGARAMAQVCDLLDAAATLACRPSMALWTVRNATGNINPQAWVRDGLPGLRELLIAEAETHHFSDADESAIQVALGQLTGMGNRKAWIYVRSLIPQEQMLKRLEGREPSPENDSLNDLGSDEPPVIIATGRRYLRDAAVRAEVMKRASGNCEFCEEPGFRCSDGKRYLECHHIIALADDGKDRVTNVIALCPGHHREAHFGERREEMEKRMVVIVREKRRD